MTYNPYEGLKLFRVKIIRGQGIIRITSRERSTLCLGYIDFRKRDLENDIVLKFWAENENQAREMATHMCTTDWDYFPKLTST